MVVFPLKNNYAFQDAVRVGFGSFGWCVVCQKLIQLSSCLFIEKESVMSVSGLLLPELLGNKM